MMTLQEENIAAQVCKNNKKSFCDCNFFPSQTMYEIFVNVL